MSDIYLFILLNGENILWLNKNFVSENILSYEKMWSVADFFPHHVFTLKIQCLWSKRIKSLQRVNCIATYRFYPSKFFGHNTSDVDYFCWTLYVYAIVWGDWLTLK